MCCKKSIGRLRILPLFSRSARAALCVVSLILFALSVALPLLAEQRMIDIGGRRISIYCDGAAARSPTVILIPAGGSTAKDWEKVQPAVSGFSRVCSYDHAGHGESDKPPATVQSVDEVVDDLHAWLKSSGEKMPFILVAHSIAGLYARRFVTRFLEEAAGLVFVDSSHEEQAWRLHELDPQGPGLDDLTARLGSYVKPGERLEWRTNLPLIVLGRGMPAPRRARDGSSSATNRMSEQQFAAWDGIWKELQQDLANRSTQGEFRLAGKSGHFIQRDQPELVIEAIRDMVNRVERAAGLRH
jgi:pimeloyl-ACP methyl ester carboxylesterase